jgi:hypothetical protein
MTLEGEVQRGKLSKLIKPANPIHSDDPKEETQK